MGRYIIIILIAIIFANLAEKYDYKRPVEVTTGTVKHTNLALFFFIISAATIIVTAGLRYYLGADYFSYYGAYEKYWDFFGRLKNIDEPGISIIYHIAKIINGGKQTPILLCSIFSLGIIMMVIYKNTDKLTFATLLVFFAGTWHGSFNAVRQYLAIAIIFYGFKFIKEKKLLYYVITVLIAYLFHKSAIVLIAAYFIFNAKTTPRNIVLILIATIVLTLLANVLFNVVGVIMDTNMGSDYQNRTINPIRIIVAIAPAIFGIYVFYTTGKDQNISIYVNILIFNAVIMTMASASAYMGRIGGYSVPFITIAIPEICKKLKAQRQLFFVSAIVLLYAAYWTYDIFTSFEGYTWVFDYM